MDTYSLLMEKLRTTQLEYASPDDPDDVSAIIKASKNNIPPMPLSKAYAWSFADHARITKTSLLDLSNKDGGQNDDLFGRNANESDAEKISGIKGEENYVFYQ